MRIYSSLYHAPKPAGIDNKQAYIVGGGIAGLAAAGFLVDDALMPGENITIFEKLRDVGGSMDGARHSQGYQCRGERELEPFMECLWYLCSKVPSLENAGRTVLDDIVDFNKDEPIHSESRALVKQGHIVSNIHDWRLSSQDRQKMLQFFTTPEDELGDMSVEDFFGKDSTFFDSNVWLCFHSMLAFKPYHSAIETQRYFERFGIMGRIEYLEGIVHTQYNEYDAIIKPIKLWLASKGVKLVTDCSVTEVQLDAACNTVTGLVVKQQGREVTIEMAETDLVFVTNGSMTQNCAFGDNNSVARTNASTVDRGVFTLWEKLAARHPKFGQPKKFISDIDRTKWISFFPTIEGYPQFMQRLEELTGSKAGTGGAITIKDSSWDISLVLHHKPFFPDQADDEEVFWAYGLFGENAGDYVKKPMWDCTGNEMMTELLYHLNLLDMKDEVLAHSYISTCMMPYITSQFMPRKRSDRPVTVPDGCTNLGFIGQYVEVPGDVVFTVETSVRTAMEAVYKLTRLDRDVLEVNPARYDLRYTMVRVKKLSGINGPITEDDLPKLSLGKLLGLWRKRKAIKTLLLKRLNEIPPYYYLYTGRDRTVPLKESILNPKYPLDTEIK